LGSLIPLEIEFAIMNTSPMFRWLGIAGIELRLDDQVLVIDPYFTRIPFWQQWFGSVRPNSALISEMLRACNYILVTHAHWDHLMDVPEVAEFTGAIAFGSFNTCQLLRVLAVPDDQVREVRSGDKLTLGPFEARAFLSQHKKAPGFLPGRISSNLRPPLRARDYRMDCCFSFMISVGDCTLLTDPGEHPDQVESADVLLVSPHHDLAYLQPLLKRIHPKVVIPNHWDDIWRPLSKPVRPMIKPPTRSFPPIKRTSLLQFKQTVEQIDPAIRVFIPEMFTLYSLYDIMGIV
jgi:L-ascorbate metabolism protein UlaG (beta-lactamase superfamily)